MPVSRVWGSNGDLEEPISELISGLKSLFVFGFEFEPDLNQLPSQAPDPDPDLDSPDPTAVFVFMSGVQGSIGSSSPAESVSKNVDRGDLVATLEYIVGVVLFCDAVRCACEYYR